jgi:hypothetical protein
VARRPGPSVPPPANKQPEPVLKIALEPQGNVVIQKSNYKYGKVPPFGPIAFEQFKEESVEELIAEFVNSGLLGYDPHAPEPQKEKRPDEAAQSTQPEPQIPVEPEGGNAGRDAGSSASGGGQVVAAIRANQATIKVTSASLIALLDERIGDLSSQPPNSDEAKANWEREVQTYRDMKDKTQSLVAAIESLLTDATKQAPVVDATLSFAGGIRKWWTESHPEICERGFDSGLFALGVMICHYAGAGGDIAAVLSATVVKGKPIIDALKAWLGSKTESSKS